MNDKLCTASELRENNHTMLSNAINDMNNVITHAESLLGRIINGEDRPDVAGSNEKSIEPTLAGVLSSAPQEIRNKSAELHDLLNKISETLF